MQAEILILQLLNQWISWCFLSSPVIQPFKNTLDATVASTTRECILKVPNRKCCRQSAITTSCIAGWWSFLSLIWGLDDTLTHLFHCYSSPISFSCTLQNHSHRFNTPESGSFGGQTVLTATNRTRSIYPFFEACHITVFTAQVTGRPEPQQPRTALTASAIDTYSLDLLRLGNCVTLRKSREKLSIRTFYMEPEDHATNPIIRRIAFAIFSFSRHQHLPVQTDLCACKNGKVLRWRIPSPVTVTLRR